MANSRILLREPSQVLRTLFSLLFFVVLWLGLVHLYRMNAVFPFWYHWDEEFKAVQVIFNIRNLHHPLLLLNTAAILEQLNDPGTYNSQHVTELGRLASAGFASAGVCILLWTAVKIKGVPAGFFVFCLVAFHPRLFELAHYFKEDSALFFGWSSVIGAARLYQRSPSSKTAFLFGIAAGLAVSGKYIGIIASLCALACVLIDHRKRVPVFLLGAVTTFCLINYQALLQPGGALEKIQWEVGQQLNNQTFVKSPLTMLWLDLGPAGTVLFAASLPVLFIGSKHDRSVLLLAFAAMSVYFIALSHISRMMDRYMLMIEVSVWWLIALGLAQILRISFISVRPLFRNLLFISAVLFCLWRLQTFPAAWEFFSAEDSRLQTARQLEGLVEPGDKLMLDFDVLFPGDVHYADGYFSQQSWQGWIPSYPSRVVQHWYKHDGEDMFETLLADGITLVAVSPRYVSRYKRIPTTTTIGHFRDVQWRRPFYERLFAEGELILENEGVPGTFVAPPLQVFRIAPPPGE